MTIVDFLRQRLDEDECLALDAASEGTPDRTGWQLWTSKKDTTPGGEQLGPRGSIEASPSRMLAEVESKRRILDLTLHGCGDDYERVQRALAAPYANHPDYREAWRPTPS